MNIYISACNEDHEIAEKLMSSLKDIKPSISLINQYDVPAGELISEYVRKVIIKSDIVVMLITTKALESTSFKLERMGIISILNGLDGKYIIPIVLDDATIPLDLSDYFAVCESSNDIKSITLRILACILQIESKEDVIEITKKEKQEKIENHSTEYIEDTLKTLSKREDMNRKYANNCYIVGYVTLICGVVFSIINFCTSSRPADASWYEYLYISGKYLIVLVFLAACSKYVFNLGKAYMNESLKNADRMHAISFGRFYLKVYGDKATWDELKEVFQYWNVDKNSFFTKLSSSEFDPKLMEAISNSIKSISSTKEKVE